MRRILRRLLRPLARLAGHLLHPKFAAVHKRIAAVQGRIAGIQKRIAAVHTHIGGLDTRVATEAATAHEAAEIMGQLLARMQEIERSLERLTVLVPETHRDWLERATKGGVEDIDETIALILNYAAGHTGFASQAGVWFNPPVHVMYAPRRAFIAGVNERIGELPYAFRALAKIEHGARILDVGATESILSLSLATLGYRVTAVDPRPNPFSHPVLRTVVGGVEDLDDSPFDAVMCISTVEHIGLAVYGQPGTDEGAHSEDGADVAAMRRIRELTKPDGLLVLTVPYGRAQLEEGMRRYDAAGLDRLLEGWVVEDRTVLRRRDPTTWILEDGATAGEGEASEVADGPAKADSAEPDHPAEADRAAEAGSAVETDLEAVALVTAKRAD